VAPPPQPIRVLVVDDSAFVRRGLAEILARDPAIELADTASDGLEALAKVRALRPDVVTLDVLMPRLDGLKVLAGIMRDRPTRVIMLSSLTQEGAEVTLQALDLGAADFVDKTSLTDAREAKRLGGELLAKIHAVAAIDPRRLGPRAAAAAGDPDGGAAAGPGGADLVVIGASTGGPPALQRVIPALPGDLPAGVVVVQHIPAWFTRPLAARLDKASALAVREAAEGDLVRPGVVLVAPGGSHLGFEQRGEAVAVRLGPDPADTPHRPSVDVTMRSAAAVYGARAAGVLLTGMGTDGAWGMWAIRARGGHAIAESEETAVVYGMPRAAVELGAADEVVPLDAVAGRIAAAVARRPAPADGEAR
jgi:two-component system chemotaxis response regulator CheB